MALVAWPAATPRKQRNIENISYTPAHHSESWHEFSARENELDDGLRVVGLLRGQLQCGIAVGVRLVDLGRWQGECWSEGVALARASSLGDVAARNFK